jgi:hypothetical protein
VDLGLGPQLNQAFVNVLRRHIDQEHKVPRHLGISPSRAAAAHKGLDPLPPVVDTGLVLRTLDDGTSDQLAFLPIHQDVARIGQRFRRRRPFEGA